MKTVVSLVWVILVTAVLSAADGGPRPDPDIFDGRFAGEAGGTPRSSAGEAPEEVEMDGTANGDGTGRNADADFEEGEDAAEVEGDSTDAEPAGAEAPARNGGHETAKTREARPGNGRGVLELGDLPEIEEIRIGGTGGIERPVEPETVEIPRVETPPLPEVGRPEQTPVAEETEETDADRSPDDERAARGDEHQPRNDPVRRVGEGSTVPTDF